MKKIIIYISVIFLFTSCYNREVIVDKTKLRGSDYRMFQNTPAWELAKAVDDEDISKIRIEVLQKKVTIDFQDPIFGNTLLMLSIMNDDYSSMEELLKLGADPNKPDLDRGETSVLCAANKTNSIKYLELILEYKGDPNSFENAPYKRSEEHRSTAILDAIYQYDTMSLQKVKMLVEAGADVNFYITDHIKTPISQAMTSHRMDVVLYLLQNGADHSLMMYDMVDCKKVYILEDLRRSVYELDSKEYKDKLKVIKFLERKGLDYSKEPIPDGVLEKIKKKYSERWESYILVY